LVDGMKYLSFKSDKIIVVSKAVEKHLIEKYKVDKEKITQIYNFVKPFDPPKKEEISNLKEELGIQEDEKVLLFIGRIGYIKGCDVLISAFEKLSDKYPYLRLMMIGNFESDGLKESTMKNDRIIYLSPTDDIYKYYYLSVIVLLPSRIDPFPYVMLEAGLAKKPFIGGKTGGIAEFIEDGIGGLLVNPGDVNNLVEKVEQLLNDSSLSKKLGSNLFTKVEQLTNVELYTNKLSELYSRLLNEAVR
jgi:glycosyltransferase involved in cell wall biosynthesis